MPGMSQARPLARFWHFDQVTNSIRILGSGISDRYVQIRLSSEVNANEPTNVLMATGTFDKNLHSQHDNPVRILRGVYLYPVCF